MVRSLAGIAKLPCPSELRFLARDSNVYWFEGNFQDHEENRKKRLGPPLLRRTS